MLKGNRLERHPFCGSSTKTTRIQLKAKDCLRPLFPLADSRNQPCHRPGVPLAPCAPKSGPKCRRAPDDWSWKLELGLVDIWRQTSGKTFWELAMRSFFLGVRNCFCPLHRLMEDMNGVSQTKCGTPALYCCARVASHLWWHGLAQPLWPELKFKAGKAATRSEMRSDACFGLTRGEVRSTCSLYQLHHRALLSKLGRAILLVSPTNAKSESLPSACSWEMQLRSEALQPPLLQA